MSILLFALPFSFYLLLSVLIAGIFSCTVDVFSCFCLVSLLVCVLFAVYFDRETDHVLPICLSCLFDFALTMFFCFILSISYRNFVFSPTCLSLLIGTLVFFSRVEAMGRKSHWHEVSLLRVCRGNPLLESLPFQSTPIFALFFPLWNPNLPRLSQSSPFWNPYLCLPVLSSHFCNPFLQSLNT